MSEILKVTPFTQWTPISIHFPQEPMGYFTLVQRAFLPLDIVLQNQEEDASPGTLCHFLEYSDMTWCQIIIWLSSGCFNLTMLGDISKLLMNNGINIWSLPDLVMILIP